MKMSDTELPSNRKFGYFFGVMLWLAATYMLYKDLSYFAYLLFVISGFFILMAIVWPSFLSLPNKLWMLLGLLLGKIVNPIILGCVFFGLFTPISLLMRLFCRDELKLKVTQNKSFWKVRDQIEPADDNFRNQF